MSRGYGEYPFLRRKKIYFVENICYNTTIYQMKKGELV